MIVSIKGGGKMNRIICALVDALEIRIICALVDALEVRINRGEGLDIDDTRVYLIALKRVLEKKPPREAVLERVRKLRKLLDEIDEGLK